MVCRRAPTWWFRKIKGLLGKKLESRGMQPVPSEQRQSLRQLGYVQILVFWFSINLTANNLTLGMLGPTIFDLSFLDSSLCAIFGMITGSTVTAYVATFGPKSGSRTMIFSRFIMGWYGTKLIVLLNIIVLLGYALIDVVVAGQILNAVGNHSLTVIVGIIVVSLITWLVSTFGYGVFHLYERYAWLPQLVVFSILIGCAGPNFDLTTNPAHDTDRHTVIGHQISFFSLNLAASITYAGGAADYFVYYPTTSSPTIIFLMTLTGLSLSFAFTLMLGIGLGSGLWLSSSWSEAYRISQGALIVEGFKPLGCFGAVCGSMVALGLIANLIPTTYSGGIDFQALGTLPAKVPRVYWNSIGALIYTVAAVVGRGSLAEILTNFLALMGYWVSIWIAIVVEEHLIFHRLAHKTWRWESWDDSKALPVGIAASIAFFVGWIGAALGMAQVWYVAPLARLVGRDGADLGSMLGFACCAFVYPPLRWIELRFYCR